MEHITMTEKNSFKQTVLSVIAAFIGVQSNKNRQRDFTKGQFSHFIIVGILAAFFFIIFLMVVVSWVIPN